MAAPLNSATISILKRLSEFLYMEGQPRFANYFEKLRVDLESSAAGEKRRDLTRRGLALFGGMNSFNDLVIMKAGKVDIDANRMLDSLRSELFECLTQDLGIRN